MRARLLGIALGMLTVLAFALGVPLVTGYADRVSQQLFALRAADTRHLAQLAESALLTGPRERLGADLERYRSVFEITAVVVDENRERVAGRLDLRGHQTAVDQALADRPTVDHRTFWPWSSDPVTVAVPVSRDGRVLGAVVTVSPTGTAREAIRSRMILVAGGGLALLALAGLGIGAPTVRWILRPVRALDAATREVAALRPSRGVPEDTGAPELRHLAVSFNTMAAQVRAAVHQQRDFVAQASHQLRNPLTVLRLSVDNLDEHVAPGGRAHLQLATAETERLAAVVDRLLELAQAEASTAERVPVDLAGVARARVAAWRDAYTARGAELCLTEARPGEPAAAFGDPEIVAHVLDSLLGNALKYAACAPVTVEVGEATAAAPGAPTGLVEIAVSDAGPGVAEVELPSVGQRFWRSPAHQNIEGTGLGLATSRILVESTGGHLQVMAVNPHGLRVAFWLPRAAAPD